MLDYTDKLTIAVRISISDGNASFSRLVGIGSTSPDLLSDLLIIFSHILTGQNLKAANFGGKQVQQSPVGIVFIHADSRTSLILAK